jgi:dTDP-glucose pyrophosphorylase
MNLAKFKKNICKSNIKIRKALYLLNIIQIKCLIILDTNKKLIGTLTDGDIRRSLINGAKFNAGIINYINKKPISIYKKNYLENKNLKNYEIPKDISLIPIINEKKKLIGIVKNYRFDQQKLLLNNLNVNVVIMAGGLGTRLRPFSTIIPKPLIPLKGKPIIEHIMDRFANSKFKKFVVSINNNQKIIKAYFKSHKKRYEINFINEKKALGTAGSLSLIKKITKDFFVINCDNIIDCNYQSILEYHQQNENDLTVVVAKKKIEIPYGVFKFDKNKKIQIIEKPSNEILINTGMYVFSKKIIKNLKKNENINMDEFIKILINKKYKIDLFPVENTEWHDFGQLSSFYQNKENFLKFTK